MASKASRDAARQRALSLVQGVFGKKSGLAGLEADGPEKPPPPTLATADWDGPVELVVGPSKQVYHSTSLCCLRPHHFPRKQAIFFIESPLFDPVILTTIICNCVTMAWESPLDPPGTAKAAFIDMCEVVYLAVFTVELLAKVLAYGFLFHEHSYLRDAWCQLDFVVVSLVCAWHARACTHVCILMLCIRLTRACMRARRGCRT